MKKEPISAYLRRRLAEQVGNHNTIAKETGVPQATVSRIHMGRVSPRLDTVQPLLDWFEKLDAGKKPRSAGRRLAAVGRRVDGPAAAQVGG